MTSNRPSGRPTSGSNVPPTSRRSARQQRLASREANRALAKAGTRGASGSSRSLMQYTAAFAVVAVVIVAVLLFVSNQTAQKASTLLAPYAPNPSVITPTSIPTDGLTLGNANAPHTLDLWEDFQCPACEAFTRDTEPQVVANYVANGKFKIVFHDWLTIDSKKAGAHESLDAANAARCAADQGMFWPYHDWLYGNQYGENVGAFTKDRLKTIAQMVGIKDLGKFNSCVDAGTHNAEVQAEQSVPLASWTGTPTIIVDGNTATPVADLTYAVVSAAMDKALGITPSPSPGYSTSAAPTGSAAPSGSAAPGSSASASASASAS
jgi:protein-disulfide isomerase